MNAAPRSFLAALAFGLCTTLPALAQVAPVDSPREPVSPRDRIERITHEDKLTRIDEVRVGGQTQSIEVSPKNGAPAFPKGHQVKLSGTDLKTLGARHVFFTAAGDKEIRANVLLPGANGQPFPSTTPVKIRVKAITPKIGIKPSK